MVREPIISLGSEQPRAQRKQFAAEGQSFSIHEWRGSGPGYLHVHHADDEAWQVLEGTVRFRFADRDIEAGAGSTVFVPAGVPHTYTTDGSGRYLIILTLRLRDLIAELQRTPDLNQHAAVMRRYESEVLE